MIKMGNKVLARGRVGVVIWIDPWDERTVAVRFRDKKVDEVAIEDCIKIETVPAKVIFTVKEHVDSLVRHIAELRHHSVK